MYKEQILKESLRVAAVLKSKTEHLAHQINSYRLYTPFAVGLICAVGFLVVFLHRQDALLNAQFWAEDGTYWFSTAYNQASPLQILHPYAGSFQVGIRIVGWIAGRLDLLAYAPLFFNLAAIACQLLPLALLFTKRFSVILPNNLARLAVAWLYLTLPFTAEVHANLTNIGWHLAIVGFLILIAPSAKHVLWRTFDIATLVLIGLTGPFCFMLAIIAGVVWLQKRDRQNLLKLVIIGACCMIQLVALVRYAHDLKSPPYPQPSLPAEVTPLDVIGERHVMSTLNGTEYVTFGTQLHQNIAWVFGVASLLLVMYVLLRGPPYLKLLVVFGWLVLISGLVRPQSGDLAHHWWGLLGGGGGRYFLIANLAFAISLFWLACQRNHKPLQGIGIACLAWMMLIGVPADWTMPEYKDLAYREHVSVFEQLPTGTRYCIPLNPETPDNVWKACLIKR